MVKDDAANDALHAGREHLNDLLVDKVRPPLPYVVINTWHVSIEIPNHRFIVNQGPKRVDKVCKPVLNRFEKALLLDVVVKLCLPEGSFTLLDILRPGYALLHIMPRQFGVNLTIIQLDQFHSHHVRPCQYMRKAHHGEEGVGW